MSRNTNLKAILFNLKAIINQQLSSIYSKTENNLFT